MTLTRTLTVAFDKIRSLFKWKLEFDESNALPK